MRNNIITSLLGKKDNLYKSKKDINLSLLQKIIDDVEEKRKNISFFPPTLDEVDISYMPTKGHSFIGLDDGLWNCYERDKYNITIKQKLPANAKNYNRIIRRNGQIERIESYVNGKLDVVHLGYYEDSRKYLFPFASDGSYYPTYTYVSVYEEGKVKEVYHTDSSQIILQQYQQLNENETDIVIVNAVPKGKVPILEHWYGRLVNKGHLEFTTFSSYIWS